ncbi:MAG: TetR/AcrR family transcriptional regulator [Firmicutes bacterium]|nr:TetR/AcrR family transcriptional regulator [Bacillota bacterium]
MSEKQDEIKSRIIEKASSYMYRYGIKRLTMEGLAEEIGISKKTLYAHFRGKKEVVDEIVVQSLRKIAGEQDELLEKATTPVERLMAIFVPLLGLAQIMDKMFFEDLAKYYPEVWKKVEEARWRRMQRVAETLEGKMDTAITGRYSPAVIGNLIMTSLSSFATPANTTRIGITPSEAVDLFFNTIVMGLLDEKERSEMRTKMEILSDTKSHQNPHQS